MCFFFNSGLKKAGFTFYSVNRHRSLKTFGWLSVVYFSLLCCCLFDIFPISIYFLPLSWMILMDMVNINLPRFQNGYISFGAYTVGIRQSSEYIQNHQICHFLVHFSNFYWSKIFTLYFQYNESPFRVSYKILPVRITQFKKIYILM